jgi:ribosomal protein S18 acetylase RimI-like enzyme
LPHAITLVPYNPDHQQAFTFYPLTPEQLEFTAHPLELLKNDAHSRTPVTILAGNHIAGFFVLDVSDDRYLYTENPNSILLRGFSIHPEYQGQGIAEKSIQALPTFIHQQFPQFDEVVLGVNERNEAARYVYLKAGFIDEGRRFMGSKGQQYALHLHVPHTIIRQAQPGDEDEIAKVCTEGQWFTYKDIYTKEEIEKIIGKDYTPARISKEIEDISPEWNGYYVAEIEGEIVGAIGGGMTNPNVAEIYVMYLHPDRRNQQIGSKLLNAYTELQQSEYQANEQWVSVAKYNDKGLPFYEAKGFTFVEEQASHEMDPQQEHISLRYKRKLL